MLSTYAEQRVVYLRLSNAIIFILPSTMPSFPRCIKCVTTSTVDDIEGLDVRCTAPCSRDKYYISVRDYFKSPVLHSREDPLPVPCHAT